MRLDMKTKSAHPMSSTQHLTLTQPRQKQGKTWQGMWNVSLSSAGFPNSTHGNGFQMTGHQETTGMNMFKPTTDQSSNMNKLTLEKEWNLLSNLWRKYQMHQKRWSRLTSTITHCDQPLLDENIMVFANGNIWIQQSTGSSELIAILNKKSLTGPRVSSWRCIAP